MPALKVKHEPSKRQNCTDLQETRDTSDQYLSLGFSRLLSTTLDKQHRKDEELPLELDEIKDEDKI